MSLYMTPVLPDELYHHGIKGQKWGRRRFQNEDMTWTEAGKERYGSSSDESHRVSESEKKKTSVGGEIARKAAVKVGTTALKVAAAYGTYKFIRSDMGKKLIKNAAKKVMNKAVKELKKSTINTGELVAQQSKLLRKKVSETKFAKAYVSTIDNAVGKVKGIGSTVKNEAVGMRNFYGNAAKNASETAKNAAETVKREAEGMRDFYSDAAKKAGSTVKREAEGMAKFYGDAAKKAGSTVKKEAEGMRNFYGNAAKKAGSTVKREAAGAAKFYGNAAKKAGATARKEAAGMRDFYGNAAKKAGAKTKKEVSGMLEFYANAAKKAAQNIDKKKRR